MTTTVVPPQAFTKADLSKAYQWLMKQEQVIQDMATTPENLVGLYRKALLYGASSIAVSSSPSTNEFKSELKELAGQLDHFDSNPSPVLNNKNESKYSSSVSYQGSKGLPPWAESKQSVTKSDGPASQRNHQHPENSKSSNKPQFQSEYSAKPSEVPKSMTEAPRQTRSHFDLESELSSQLAANIEASASHGNFTSEILSNPPIKPRPQVPSIPPENGLDANSRAMVNEIRRKMNLSTDAEALRMMISIGYEKLKQVF